MKLATTEYITGKELGYLGLVKGSVVQAKHIGKDLMAIAKTMAGGEITGYTELLQEARSIATERMIEEAKKLGADAIVSIRYTTSNIMDTASEVMAYGTAVKFN